MIKIPEDQQQAALEASGFVVSGDDIFLDLHEVSCVIDTEGSRGGKIIFKNGTELSVTSGTTRGIARAMRKWKISEMESTAFITVRDHVD